MRSLGPGWSHVTCNKGVVSTAPCDVPCGATGHLCGGECGLDQEQLPTERQSSAGEVAPLPLLGWSARSRIEFRSNIETAMNN